MKCVCDTFLEDSVLDKDVDPPIYSWLVHVLPDKHHLSSVCCSANLLIGFVK